jgi:hypothetical protein
MTSLTLYTEIISSQKELDLYVYTYSYKLNNKSLYLYSGISKLFNEDLPMIHKSLIDYVSFNSNQNFLEEKYLEDPIYFNTSFLNEIDTKIYREDFSEYISVNSILAFTTEKNLNDAVSISTYFPDLHHKYTEIVKLHGELSEYFYTDIININYTDLLFSGNLYLMDDVSFHSIVDNLQPVNKQLIDTVYVQQSSINFSDALPNLGSKYTEIFIRRNRKFASESDYTYNYVTTELNNNLLKPPDNWKYVVVESVGSNGLSIFDEANPPVIPGDVYQYSFRTTPSGYEIFVRPDGTFYFDEFGGTISNEQFEGYLWRLSTSEWTQKQTINVSSSTSDAHLALTSNLDVKSICQIPRALTVDTETSIFKIADVSFDRLLTTLIDQVTISSIRSQQHHTSAQSYSRNISEYVNIHDESQYTLSQAANHQQALTSHAYITDLPIEFGTPNTHTLEFLDTVSPVTLFNYTKTGPQDFEMILIDRVYLFSALRWNNYKIPIDMKTFQKDEDTVRLVWG